MTRVRSSGRIYSRSGRAAQKRALRDDLISSLNSTLYKRERTAARWVDTR